MIKGDARRARARIPYEQGGNFIGENGEKASVMWWDFRAFFARKPELNGVDTLAECVACSVSASESPNATLLGHTLASV